MRTPHRKHRSWRATLETARTIDGERLERLRPLAERWLRDPRYLPWDQFRYRCMPLDPNGEDVVWLWALVKEGRALRGRQLFLERGLTEPLWYVPTHRIQTICHALDRTATTHAFLGKFPGLGRSTDIGSAHILHHFAVEEAIRSSQLEGASTTRRVAEDMLERQRAPRDASERMILSNYRMMQEIYVRKDALLSVDLILDLHRVGMTSIDDAQIQPGVLRSSDDVRVMAGDRLVHQPPVSEELRGRLEEMCAWYNDSGGAFIHPLIRAITLHFLLAHTHPFYDGNGRTSRALFYWAAMKEGYAPLRFVSISAALRKSAGKYSHSFEAVQQDEFDLTYFIEAQLQVIYEQFQNLERLLQNRRDALDAAATRWKDSSVYHELVPRRREILRIFLTGAFYLLRAKDIAEFTGVTQSTALNDLRALEHHDFLVEVKKGRTHYFHVNIENASHIFEEEEE